MKRKLLISIIIPTWNSEKYIGRAIQSVIDGGIDDFEIVIVDNLSTDNTKEIALSFEDERITFLSKKDKSLYDALNNGIKEARADIIGWIGSDDQYAPKALKFALEALLKANANWLAGGGKFIYEQDTGKEVFYYPDTGINLSSLIAKNQLMSPSIIFKKNLYFSVGGFNLKYKLAADYDLWLRFASKEEPLIFNGIISYFSINPYSYSSNKKIEMYLETMSIIRKASYRKYYFSYLSNLIRLKFYIYFNLIKNKIK